MSVSLQRRPSIQTVSKALATSRKTAPVKLSSPKFSLFLQRGGPAARKCYGLV